MSFAAQSPQEPHSAEYGHLKRTIPLSSGQASDKLTGNTPQSIKAADPTQTKLAG